MLIFIALKHVNSTYVMPALEHEILSEIELILVGMASCVLPSKFLLFLLALFGNILKGIFAQIPI